MVCHYFDIEDLIQNQTLDFYFPEVAEGEVENILSGVIEYTKMKLIDFAFYLDMMCVMQMDVKSL